MGAAMGTAGAASPHAPRSRGVYGRLALAGISLGGGMYAAVAATWPGWMALRFGVGFALAWLAQFALICALRRRIGAERSTMADLLTLARMTIGSALAGLVVAGLRGATGRESVVGWLAWGAALLAASALDWLDGPLARRLGPTRLGGALDIEADSWLTLWSAAGAVAWGGLPWWMMIAPILRYIHPIRAMLRGGLPRGGDPWWGLVTGVAQMAMLLTALAPIVGQTRDAALWLASIPISAGQTLAMLVMLRGRRSKRA